GLPRIDQIEVRCREDEDLTQVRARHIETIQRAQTDAGRGQWTERISAARPAQAISAVEGHSHQCVIRGIGKVKAARAVDRDAGWSDCTRRIDRCSGDGRHPLKNDRAVRLDSQPGQGDRVEPSLAIAKLRVADGELAGSDHSTYRL